MSKSKVAIIIPCLQAATTIEACIASALGQSYDALHVHIQDGGSTDGTLQILKKYTASNFSFSTESDLGVYDAINKAIQKIDADWYYILGSDDKITGLDAVASVMALQKNPYKILYGDVRYGHRSNKLIPAVHQSQYNSSLFWKNSLHQQGAFYHASLLHPNGFDISYRILADYAFHIYLYRSGVQAKHTGMTLCSCSADGLSKQFTLRLYMEELRIKRKLLPTSLYLMNIPWVFAKWLIKKLAAPF